MKKEKGYPIEHCFVIRNSKTGEEEVFELKKQSPEDDKIIGESITIRDEKKGIALELTSRNLKITKLSNLALKNWKKFFPENKNLNKKDYFG